MIRFSAFTITPDPAAEEAKTEKQQIMVMVAAARVRCGYDELGETTNMLDIVTAMQLADKVINIYSNKSSRRISTSVSALRSSILKYLAPICTDN